jgi:acyl-CoA hydrolase
MKLVDTAGAIAAHRHGRTRVVTAEVDSMRFLNPVHVGDLVTLKARVTTVWETSLEAMVEVEAENVLTGKLVHVSSAYLVFVAIDEAGTPTRIAPVIAETPDEKRRQQAARRRRELRLARPRRENTSAT